MTARGRKSKKRSATSSKLPDDITFFLDESLGRRVVARALRDAGVRVEVHTDHFPRGTKDEVWLGEVGRKGWIVLTKDARIRYREVERIALLNARVRTFVLTAKGLQGKQIADVFVGALPRISRFLTKHRSAFIASISRSGIISLLISDEDARHIISHGK